MSYRCWVWRQPNDEHFPTNLPDSFALLGRLHQQAAPDDTRFRTLAKRLMAHFPCSSAPDTASTGSVWTEGALDGSPPGAVTFAAKRRHLASQRVLAAMYANGRGTEKDLAQAAYWYGEAAADEDESSQLALGLAYKNGEGVERNLATAKRWIRRSAAHGDRGALFAMGTLYLRGEGVTANVVLAYALQRFASIGNVLMRSDAERLTPDASLNPSTLQEAQQLLHTLNRAPKPLDYIEQTFGRIDQ